MRATWNTITKTLPNCTGIICASKRALGTTTLESFISGPNNKSIHTAYFTLAKHTKTQTRAHKHTAQAHLPHKAHANPTKLPFEILTGFSPLKQFAQIIIKKTDTSAVWPHAWRQKRCTLSAVQESEIMHILHVSLTQTTTRATLRHRINIWNLSQSLLEVASAQLEDLTHPVPRITSKAIHTSTLIPLQSSWKNALWAHVPISLYSTLALAHLFFFFIFVPSVKQLTTMTQVGSCKIRTKVLEVATLSYIQLQFMPCSNEHV